MMDYVEIIGITLGLIVVFGMLLSFYVTDKKFEIRRLERERDTMKNIAAANAKTHFMFWPEQMWEHIPLWAKKKIITVGLGGIWYVTKEGTLKELEEYKEYTVIDGEMVEVKKDD